VDADVSTVASAKAGGFGELFGAFFTDVDAAVFEQADVFGVQAYSNTGVSTVRTGRAFPWIVRWICSTVSGEKNGSPVS
jgi:hypothetical protein